MIRVSHLTKRYGERVVVRDLDFAVKKGEVVGFLGPNGAGKSTTLRMLTGFVEPTGGEITIDGIDAREHPIEARKKLGYMPEATPLYPEMRVVEYLRFRGELKGVSRRDLKKRVDVALEKARVTDVATRLIGQLSKGYKQRVGLADALVADPPLLILDEPTAGLDPNQIRQVRDLVRSLAGEHTVLLSTHILPEVESTCGRVIILHKGKLVAEGPVATARTQMIGGDGQVLSLVGRGAREALEKAVRDVEGVRKISDVALLEQDLVRLRVEADPRAEIAEAVFAAIAKAGLVLRELKSEAISLEDVFAQLTTAEPSEPQTPEGGAQDSKGSDAEGEGSDSEASDPKESTEKPPSSDGEKKEGSE